MADAGWYCSYRPREPGVVSSTTSATWSRHLAIPWPHPPAGRDPRRSDAPPAVPTRRSARSSLSPGPGDPLGGSLCKHLDDAGQTDRVAGGLARSSRVEVTAHTTGRPCRWVTP